MAMVVTAQSQSSFTSPTTLFVMHSSGNHLKMASDYGGQLEAPNAANAQQMTIVPNGNGYYYIRTSEKRYLSKVNTWNTSFVTDPSTDNALFSFEQAQGAYIRSAARATASVWEQTATMPAARSFPTRTAPT